MPLRLARFCAIVDPVVRPDLPLAEIARALAEAGVRLVQLRDKQATSLVLLEQARQLLSLLPPDCSLIINDRADVAALAGAAGVHLGQDDLPVAAARALLGPQKIIGLSTHNQAQLEAAQTLPANYLALGPVFATATKADTEPVVGLERLRVLRRLTAKPLVAIGGITPENAASVLAAGVDTVAVISGWLAAENIPQRLDEFRRVLGGLD
ncbi:MAG TPA: thiamine phosphate synthase [Candidatus Acidoferrales bacterium]|nr:thiamine phosphate synthase [Candidatus Acidoferrales bacterium]